MEWNFNQNKSDLIREELKKYIEPRSNEFRAIAEITGSTYNHVKLVYYRDKKAAIHIETKGEPNWEVIGDSYKWECQNGIIDIPVSKIDELFYEYSKHGRDLSGTKVRNKHNLKPWEWNTIKSRLQLFKDSNIFSPYTWDNTAPNEREKMVAEKIAAKFEDAGQTVVDQYEKVVRKEYEKEIAKGQKSKFFSNELYAQLSEVIKPVTEYKLSKSSYYRTASNIVLTIADLHIGAQVSGLRITQDYNNEILKGYLEQTAKETNSLKAKTVTLNILGDLIESFTGMNHPNSFKSMMFGGYGVKAVIMAFEILSDFISSIDNLTEINGVGGNHDRPTASSKLESDGEIAELIFFMLSQRFPTLKVNYNHSVLVNDIGNIRYIIAHGDKAHSKESKLGDLLFHHGSKDMFNIVSLGHLHSRITRKDGYNHRVINFPSMFTGNKYSDDLGFSARAGFIIIEDVNGLPRVTDYTL